MKRNLSFVDVTQPVFKYAGTTVTMFLFGEAHQDNFRQSEGSVVAISNALARSSEGKHDVSLKVTESSSILMLGTSSDFALCGSRKRVRPDAEWLHLLMRLSSEDFVQCEGPIS